MTWQENTAPAAGIVERFFPPPSTAPSVVGDPIYFTVDWEQTTGVLVVVVIFAFFLERGLSTFMEADWFLKNKKLAFLKEWIAVIVAIAVCANFRFDALSIIVRHQTWTPMGVVLTGLVIAGGSKASIKLFRDILDFKSEVRRQQEREKSLDNLDKLEDRLNAGAKPGVASLLNFQVDGGSKGGTDRAAAASDPARAEALQEIGRMRANLARAAAGKAATSQEPPK